MHSKHRGCLMGRPKRARRFWQALFMQQLAPRNGLGQVYRCQRDSCSSASTARACARLASQQREASIASPNVSIVACNRGIKRAESAVHCWDGL